jgi:hypothetical protein
MMHPDRRYSFWRIFWVVLAVNVILSLLAVLVIFISPIVNRMGGMDSIFSIRNLLSQLAGIAFASGFYYYTINEYYNLMVLKKPVSGFLKTSGIAFLFLAAYFMLSHFFLSDKKLGISVDENNFDAGITTGLLVFGYAFSSCFYFGVALLVSYLTTLRDEKKQRKILEEQKLQLEIEKSQANFNFLKAQINPHFLHNTLNFLYAKSLPYSAELSEGILTLSDIMRYALSEGIAKDGKAPLKDEIEHVRNVIKINQLRFSNKLHVDFTVEGVVNGATIIPFVLITLVENAFKHGDLKSTEDPITIRLKINENAMYFYCSNKKKSGPKELSTGIGLDNIQKRLDLAYRKNYRLHIADDEVYYVTELTIFEL